jgi:hypothetical protein
MARIEVEKLNNDELDYWVARAEGITHPPTLRDMEPGFVMTESSGSDEDGHFSCFVAYSPSTDWNIAGNIIHREKIGLDTWQGQWGAQFTYARPSAEDKFSPSHHRMLGDTPMVAAMRTYVSLKFGPYFDVDKNGNTTVAERPERPKFKPLKQSSED